MLEEVLQSELQIGELYSDTCRLNGYNTVIMRYLGYINGSHNFKYVCGNSEYIDEGDGIIRFGHHKKEPYWYWKVPQDVCDTLNKSQSNILQKNNV